MDRKKSGIGLFLVMLWFVFSCNSGQNSITQELISPTGKVKAVMFDQEGDMITQNSIHVSLLPAEDHLVEQTDGNVFIADAGNDRQAFEGPFSFSWRSDTLYIDINKRLHILKREERYQGYTIVYRPFTWEAGQMKFD